MSVDHIIFCFALIPPSAYITSKSAIIRRNLLFLIQLSNPDFNLNKYESLIYLSDTATQQLLNPQIKSSKQNFVAMFFFP